MIESLLENDAIPTFMHPSLQDDIELVRRFFQLGPRQTRQIRAQHGLRTKIITHKKMDSLIRASLDFTRSL